MKRYETVEEYARKVNAATSPLLGGLCSRFGPTHPTTLAILDLLTESANIMHGQEMEQEIEGSFDLGELAAMVDADSASNSETPFEDD